MQQLPARPGQLGHVPPPSQTILMSNVQSSRPITSGLPQPQQNVQTLSSYSHGFGGLGLHISSSYTFAPSSYGLPQLNSNVATQHPPVLLSQVPSIPTREQSKLSSEKQASVAPVQHSDEHFLVATSTIPAPSVQPNVVAQAPSDWLEHASDGRRYYYNKKTRQSTWEKPLELMTPIERADASTDWKEYRSPDGRKYYFNKVTKQSKWTIPDELKLAREQAEEASIKGKLSETSIDSSVSLSVVNVPSTAADSSLTSHSHRAASSPVPVAPVAAVDNLQPAVAPASSALSAVASTAVKEKVEIHSPGKAVTPVAAALGSPVRVTLVDAVTPTMSNSNNIAAQNILNSVDGLSTQNVEKAKTGIGIAAKSDGTSSEGKMVDQEPLSYGSKQEAKNAFIALLESVNVESNWTWDQAMRVIINDKRYGALRTLGERKQAFNEFLGQRKRQEVEEWHAKQKRAREEFRKMLEESEQLTSSTKWSKAITLFENDERFQALERARDREDLFKNFLAEIEKKERAKALEEHKRNIIEYREFLESCDFIKSSSQWRKVKDRLEADERCSRLENIARLEVFQEYLRDLEEQEEEQRKLQKEELRKAERRNRDEFRKLMEGHVAAGTLTAKTHWRDYCMKVKDLHEYLAVSSNTSGSTPKDLFEDVAEELQKQYHEDKTRIKDALKFGKITLSLTWTLEDFKDAISESVNSPPISDINLKLAFNELLERVREKEEKEAKKRKRLVNEFVDLLRSTKEITASSNWEECKPLLMESQMCRSVEEENFCKEIFEEYIAQLEEKMQKEEKEKKKKEREEREKRKAKHKREKNKGYDRERGTERSREDGTDSENIDVTDIHASERNISLRKETDKKHRKRHQSTVDDVSLDKNEKNRSKNIHKLESSHKKSRQGEQHEFSPDFYSESKHKRHKRDHLNGSRRHGDYEDFEDGEFG
ncbi:pre-mRNA-processing protein 40A-like isoform X2 [Malania oleifera]|nr:pre-mRNA-processing protein 40A-like isoform X2 [Malania oleifera]